MIDKIRDDIELSKTLNILGFCLSLIGLVIIKDNIVIPGCILLIFGLPMYLCLDFHEEMW